LLPVFRLRLLESQALPPHEQQGEHIAEAEPRLLQLVLEAEKALEEHLIVDGRPLLRVGGDDTARPEAERLGGRSLRGGGAIILAHELARLFEQHTEDLFARPQLAAGHGTTVGVRLDLVVGHVGSSCPVHCGTGSSTIPSYRTGVYIRKKSDASEC